MSEKYIKNVSALLRISIGALFFYAGVSKLANPAWSAVGYLNSAKTFASLYEWFASPANIGWVNFVNEWGLTIVGVLLILGIFKRFACYSGVILMALYYLPILDFPKVGDHSYLVDEHIIYILVLLLLAKLPTSWSVSELFRKNKQI